MMLGLSIPILAGRGARGPVPPLPSASITNIVFEGDSLTGASVVGQDSGSWAWQYLAVRPAGATAVVRAQGSRYTGRPSMLDDGSNTLFGHLTADATTHGGQLIWAAPFLTNDFGSSFHGEAGSVRAANIRSALASYRAEARARGCKVAFGVAPPLRSDAPANPDWAATRAAFVANLRDPAVWGSFADYYLPVGEQPDFHAVDNTELIGTDGVHPTTAGQARLLAANRPAADTLLDPSRASATRVYPGAWPTSETGLPTATVISRRFVISGLAHKGVALGGGVALAATGGGEVRVNGGAWSAAASGWLYNGDHVDLRLTTSAVSDTATGIDLTIGSETRTLTYRTGAQTAAPVGYAHGDVAGSAPQRAVHTYAARDFGGAGLAVIGLAARAGATGVSVGGVAAVRRATQPGIYGEMTLELWTAPLAASGARDVIVTFAASQNKSVVSWGVVTGANPGEVQATANAADGGDPHGTGALSVPVNGLALGVFGEYGSATITSATLVSGTGIDEGAFSFQGETFGLALAQRTTPGALVWNFGYGPYPIAALVFMPA